MAIKITIAEAAHDENGPGNYGYEGSIPGDQLQKHQYYTNETPRADYYDDEVRFNGWYNKPWVHIYRPVDPNIANVIAIRAEQVVRNHFTGYSQPGRNSGADFLIYKDPDPSHINYPLEFDCSSMVNSIVYVSLKSVGINPTINGYEVTSQMANKYNQMCPTYFIDVINEVNLTTGEGLKRGDILLGAPATHTAIVVYVDNLPGFNKDPKGVGKIIRPTFVYKNHSICSGLLKEWSKLGKDNLVDICDEHKNWYYIRIAGKYYGWIKKNCIK